MPNTISANRERLFDKNLSRSQVIKLLKSYLKYVNKNKGSDNCFEVSRRVAAILRDGMQEAYKKPVTCKKTKAVFIPMVRKGNIVTSSIAAHDLPEIADPKDNDDFTMVLNENNDGFDSYLDLTSSKDNVNSKFARIKKICKEDLLQTLRSLPVDIYGRCYGFIIYTWPDNGKGEFRNGHMANFYVDANKEVYFIDAQGLDNRDWIKDLPETQAGYRSELFYAPCILKSEQKLIIIKEEPSEEDAPLVMPSVKQEGLKQETIDNACEIVDVPVAINDAIDVATLVPLEPTNHVSQHGVHTVPIVQFNKNLLEIFKLINHAAEGSIEQTIIQQVKCQNFDFFRFCLAKSKDPDYNDVWEATLTYAEQNLCSDIRKTVAYTLNNIGFEEFDHNGCSALLYACYYGAEDVIRIILDYKVDINIQGNLVDIMTVSSKYTPILIAARNNHLTVVKLLLEKYYQEININFTDNQGFSVKDYLKKHLNIDETYRNAWQQGVQASQFKMLLDKCNESIIYLEFATFKQMALDPIQVTAGHQAQSTTTTTEHIVSSSEINETDRNAWQQFIQFKMCLDRINQSIAPLANKHKVHAKQQSSLQSSCPTGGASVYLSPEHVGTVSVSDLISLFDSVIEVANYRTRGCYLIDDELIDDKAAEYATKFFVKSTEEFKHFRIMGRFSHKYRQILLRKKIKSKDLLYLLVNVIDRYKTYDIALMILNTMIPIQRIHQALNIDDQIVQIKNQSLTSFFIRQLLKDINQAELLPEFHLTSAPSLFQFGDPFEFQIDCPDPYKLFMLCILSRIDGYIYKEKAIERLKLIEFRLGQNYTPNLVRTVNSLTTNTKFGQGIC